MNIYITNENHRLTDVIVGNSFSFKSNINFRDLYDPISLFYYLRGKFPNKYKLQNQISNFKKVLLKYGVKIHDLDIINTNQIFVRDLGFIIENKFFISSILPDRENEIKGLKNVLKKIKNVIKLPKDAHIEGGDVVLDEDNIFVGYYGQKDYKNQITARTNKKAIKLIKNHFPSRNIIPLELLILELVKILNINKKNISIALNSNATLSTCYLYPDVNHLDPFGEELIYKYIRKEFIKSRLMQEKILLKKIIQNKRWNQF